MVKLDKIYTKGGDKGESGLVDGSRQSKDAPVFRAIGAVEEANAAIGVAMVVMPAPNRELLQQIQNDLFDLGADLATPLGGPKDEGALRIVAEQVVHLEAEIDRLTGDLAQLTSFILPGGTQAAAALHLARTIVRRAERRAVALNGETELNAEALKYLNRLSDLLFQLARVANNAGQSDGLWKPGGGR